MARGRSARSPWVAVGLLAAVLAIYAQTFRFGTAQSDDLLYVSDNGVVQAGLSLRGVAWSFTSHYAANWHPLTWLSLMLDVTGAVCVNDKSSTDRNPRDTPSIGRESRLEK